MIDLSRGALICPVMPCDLPSACQRSESTLDHMTSWPRSTVDRFPTDDQPRLLRQGCPVRALGPGRLQATGVWWMA
jgi:hypothetical protein